MASKQPERYKRVVNELLQYGSSTLGNQNYDPLTNTGENNAYTIRADGNAFGGNDLLDVDPKGKDYPNNGGIKMNQADFILLSSIKNSKNDFMNYNGKKDSWVDQYAGITMPSGIASLMTDMLGATDVENKTNLLMSGGGIDALKKIQSDFATGKSVLMFVNSGMIDGSNGTSSITANHWIVYQGELKIDETQKTVQFKAYSWGGLQTFSMSIETFHDNFYGTVSGTVPAKPDK